MISTTLYYEITPSGEIRRYAYLRREDRVVASVACRSVEELVEHMRFCRIKGEEVQSGQPNFDGIFRDKPTYNPMSNKDVQKVLQALGAQP